MAYCKKCGKSISKEYLFCYNCNKTSKTFKDENGYVRFKDSGDLVHRYVAELKLGRRLKPWEVVHHIDRDKTNNDPSNIWVFKNQYDHDDVHSEDEERFGVTASYRGFQKKKHF